MRMKATMVLSSLLACSMTFGSDLLGPEWVEDDKGDAGPLPNTSQTTTGIGQLGAIRGSVDGKNPATGLPDFEDMYLIRITDPDSFCATTNPLFGEGAFAEFDTRLYLFSLEGKGLLGNDNSSDESGGAAGTAPLGACCADFDECIDNLTQDECESKFGGQWQGPNTFCDDVNCGEPKFGACCLDNGQCIDELTFLECKKEFNGNYQGDNSVCGQVNCGEDEGTSTIGNFSTDGTNVVITKPGYYLLAVCTVPRRPKSPPGSIFKFTMPFEVSGPDGDGGEEVIDDWEDEDPGVGPIGGLGEYRIVLCGVGFAQSLCFADLNGDLVIDPMDLAILIDAWGSSNPVIDLSGDGIVNHLDLALLLGEWGDCF